MGIVGLAGAFAGLDLFSDSPVTFDPATSTLLSRSRDGSLSRLASTNSGGSILAGCALDNTFYLAGDFSSINGLAASNVASYSPSSGDFAAVGSNSPNGQVNALFCDTKDNKLWAGGKFSSPGSSIAVYDPEAGSWAAAPFTGIAGAQAQVNSISTNSSDESIFFAGSFLTGFGNANAALNGTNNPNIDASPSSTQSGFSNIQNVLCPAGPDGSGNSWFAADNSTPLVTVRTFSFISANGVRLGNTFQPDHGTTGFTVTTIPDNTVQTLKYVDPTTGQNTTCSDPCPLSTDSSILYQDFLFDRPLAITGVQIKLSQFTGASAGLHFLQLLSSGAFASSIEQNNGPSCFAPAPSNATQTGQWSALQVDTDIPGTVQNVLVSSVPVGTLSSSGPTFTWMPYVSAAGNYDIRLVVPGCIALKDCAARTSVQVTIFPGGGLPPFIQTVSQQNTENAATTVYSGPILPTSPDFSTTIRMSLADSPVGTGQNGQWTILADRVELVLTSANATASSDGTNGTGGVGGLARGFGFFEWPRSASSTSGIDGRRAFPNTTLTSLDTLGFDVLSGLGGVNALASANLALNAVAFHSSGLFVGGSFALTSGPASGSSNIVSFKNGVLAGLADGGLNGEVLSLLLNGDQLFVGGSFKDTRSGSTGDRLSGIAIYNVQTNSWTPLNAGVDGAVFSIGLVENQIQVAGNFTKILSSPNSNTGIDAPGFAAWNVETSTWVNSGGFVSGRMTFVGNADSSTQFVAGSVSSSRKFGASGLVMLQNGDENGPEVLPLSVDLSGAVSSSTSSSSLTRRAPKPRSAWMSHMKFSHIFARQSTPSQQTPLPAALPAAAPAVLAGAFWKNGSQELAILGGNFSFVATGASSSSEAVAIYDQESSTVQGLSGAQINGIVRTLLVVGDSLFIGGEFTIPGASINGLALYDLSRNAWNLDGLQSLQPTAGSTVVVRSITQSDSRSNLIFVAGSFAQAGSLRCQAICSFDMTSRQWNALGNGIQGEVSSVAYSGNNQETLVAGGSINLADNTASNVVEFNFDNATWVAVGTGSEIPGPVTALEVNSGNSSSLFAAGQSSDGTSSFLAFWNGERWSTLGSTLSQGSTVSQLTMVPLQNTHTANSIIEADRMLMISGALSTSSGNASSALYDGQTVLPYIVSTSASGTAGSVSSLFHSFKTFSFSQRKFLATGVVILISIAIAAGVVFLLALIGILWTLFSRKDDKLNKYDVAQEEDDDSAHHRPSSLLEHINAATRSTIIGASPYSNYNAEKEEKSTGGAQEQDPFGPDASNYLRAETPSDAIGGLLAEETSRPAHARYSFDGTGEGELPLNAGAEVEVLDDRDPAWWYARDVRSGQEGVVPAAYLY
ncbi:hypothetical protein NLJ89_g8037 [Agrocybe chaxingu]|uniref:SH3 domain-containing protein n=1 Tax=Agrocybe chaxingu TaxID=84603 RepID=A0A9W8JVN3_9AGAR|nr:hypothetical protein NLJ89_g8037 [Agrocybe chaxingu]